MDLTLTTREADGKTIVAVGGEIDVYTAPKLRDKISELVATGAYDIVVDMHEVEFLDSTGPRRAGGRPEEGARPRRLAPAGLQPGPAAQDLPDHRPGQGLRDPRDRRRGARRGLSRPPPIATDLCGAAHTGVLTRPPVCVDSAAFISHET